MASFLWSVRVQTVEKKNDLVVLLTDLTIQMFIFCPISQCGGIYNAIDIESRDQIKQFRFNSSSSYQCIQAVCFSFRDIRPSLSKKKKKKEKMSKAKLIRRLATNFDDRGLNCCHLVCCHRLQFTKKSKTSSFTVKTAPFHTRTFDSQERRRTKCAENLNFDFVKH